MPAGGADRGNRLGPQFVGELAELVRAQLAEVVGRRNGVEQRGFIYKKAKEPFTYKLLPYLFDE